MPTNWPSILPTVQVRIARPTDQLKEVVHFYQHGLGLQIISSFTGHSGYDGVMLGLPGVDYHLEFTQHVDGSPCLSPTKDNLLVFYIPDQTAIECLTERLSLMGYPPVSPENPWWRNNGVTIEDPDGWRIVLMNSLGYSPDP